jgi:hypothetical protein
MHVEKVESVNADHLRLGETYRACILSPSIAHEMSDMQLATMCTQYTPRRLPLYKRPLAVLGLVNDPGRYNPEVEEYKPLSPEEIKQLQAENPAAPAVTPAPSGDDQVTALKKEIGLDTALASMDEDQGIFNDKEDQV